MALIPKLGKAISESSLTSNKNFLSPVGFRLILARAPNVEFFCQAAGLPGLNLGQIIQPNQFSNVPRPGSKIEFEPLSIRFRIDENMENWLEIMNWLYELGRPTNFSGATSEPERFSDATLVILSSHNNPNKRVIFCHTDFDD